MNEVTTTDGFEPTISTKKDYFGALDDRLDTFSQVLPDDVEPKFFVSVCKTAIAKDPKLLNAIQRNPQSVFQAFMNCARDGLIPDGREAHIDARNCKHMGAQAAYMPMKRGILKRLHRSAEIKEIGMNAVYEGDIFHPDLGEGGRIHHEPKGLSRNIIAAYAYVVTHRDGNYRKVLWPDDIERRRRCASTDAVWTRWPAEMAAKSALRVLADELPLSSEDRRLVDSIDDFTDLNAELAGEPDLPKRLNIGDPSLALVSADDLMMSDEVVETV